MKLVEKMLKSSGLAAAAALLSFGLGTPEAQACGGFFCNNTNPTVQTGERILFSVEDENIRAYVQVYYDGPADDFAWIIPVASNPDVGVGTDEVFTRLDQLTSPRFEIEMNIADECYDQGIGYFGYDSVSEAAPNSGGGDEGGEGGGEYVNVIAQGDAGPYNYTTLESNNSDLLVAWLNENDYAQPPEALPLIEHYVANEMLFVAVKLQPAKDVGDIAPIILDFQEQSPCVPLVLTQVAASPDMPVKAYVLGKERAVPTNWLHVTVNEKKLDWFSLQNNWWAGENLEDSYHTTLIDAIAEAEGHAFTTEFAGDAKIMDKQLDNGQYDNVSQLLELEDPADFVMALQNYFTGSTQLLNILRTHIPVPEGYSEQDFYNWPEGYSAEYAAMDVDLEALYNELIEVIVTPIQEAQDMFDKHPYLTRLYSRVGIDSMDRDPIFDFQAGEDVSNQHKAIFTMTCGAEGMTYEMELENGETFIPTNLPSWWNIDETANGGSAAEDIAALPAAERIELFTPGAAPRTVERDDAAYVDEQLDILPSEQVEVPGADLVEDVNLTTTGTNIRSGGCSTGAAGQNNLGWMMLLMVGLASLRRTVVNRS
jgi:hypothetical protein